jgi:hypothetical protein
VIVGSVSVSCVCSFVISMVRCLYTKLPAYKHLIILITKLHTHDNIYI